MTDASSGNSSILDLDEFLCFAIHSTGFAFNRIYRRPLSRLGLTYPQFLAMAALWGQNGVPVGTLCAKLSLDTNTLTPLLKRLESLGLVARVRSKDDERKVIASLTENGWAMRSHASEILRCIFAAADMSPAAFAQLTRDIQALRRNLERAGDA
jgi:MarR family transcriptional regulator, organic hydroperoxide resistance regulator